MSEEISLLHLSIILVLYAVGFVAFGHFYAKEEGKSKPLCILLAFGAFVVWSLLSFIPLLPTIVVCAAVYYVADKKNRNRLVWIVLALIAGRTPIPLSPILFLILLFLPRRDQPAGAPISIRSKPSQKSEPRADMPVAQQIQNGEINEPDSSSEHNKEAGSARD